MLENGGRGASIRKAPRFPVSAARLSAFVAPLRAVQKIARSPGAGAANGSGAGPAFFVGRSSGRPALRAISERVSAIFIPPLASRLPAQLVQKVGPLLIAPLGGL